VRRIRKNARKGQGRERMAAGGKRRGENRRGRGREGWEQTRKMEGGKVERKKERKELERKRSERESEVTGRKEYKSGKENMGAWKARTNICLIFSLMCI